MPVVYVQCPMLNDVFWSTGRHSSEHRRWCDAIACAVRLCTCVCYHVYHAWNTIGHTHKAKHYSSEKNILAKWLPMFSCTAHPKSQTSQQRRVRTPANFVCCCFLHQESQPSQHYRTESYRASQHCMAYLFAPRTNVCTNPFRILRRNEIQHLIVCRCVEPS